MIRVNIVSRTVCILIAASSLLLLGCTGSTGDGSGDETAAVSALAKLEELEDTLMRASFCGYMELLRLISIEGAESLNSEWSGQLISDARWDIVVSTLLRDIGKVPSSAQTKLLFQDSLNYPFQPYLGDEPPESEALAADLVQLVEEECPEVDFDVGTFATKANG